MPVLFCTVGVGALFVASSNISVVIESVAKELALPSQTGGSAQQCWLCIVANGVTTVLIWCACDCVCVCIVDMQRVGGTGLGQCWDSNVCLILLQLVQQCEDVQYVWHQELFAHGFQGHHKWMMRAICSDEENI